MRSSKHTPRGERGVAVSARNGRLIGLFGDALG
jgi:hypothetical protein